MAFGANPNATDDIDVRGWTALMAAAKVGYVEIRKLLMQRRADTNGLRCHGT